MRVFKTKRFAKWAKKERLTDGVLCKVIGEMDQNTNTGRLSDFIYKRRVALPGRGKRGGARMILAFRAGDKAFFIFGFAKNELDNIEEFQLRQLRILGSLLLNYRNEELEYALKERELAEVNCNE